MQYGASSQDLLELADRCWAHGTILKIQILYTAFCPVALCDSYPGDSAGIARIGAGQNPIHKIWCYKNAAWPNTFQMVLRVDPDHGSDHGNFSLVG